MKTDRSSVQVRKIITFTRWRDKLRNQPRLKDHQAHRNSKGSVATQSEEDTATATLCLSLDASGASCHDRQSELSTESWKCEEGNSKSTQSLVTSSVHSRKAQTYVPVRDNLRSQPGRKNHQAHRNCKGSSNRKRGRLSHYVYRWMPQDQTVATICQRNRQSPGSVRRRTLSQPSHSTLQVSKEHNPMGRLRLGHA